MKRYQQDFSDVKTWEEKLNNYVANDACMIGNDIEIWELFQVLFTDAK